MTAITTTSAVPTVGGDADTWGGKLNDKWAAALVDLTMLNTAPANTILGRNEGTTGEVERLTPTEVVAMLPQTELTARANAFTGDSGTGGVKGDVPAPAAGDGAAKKVLQADGTWGTEIKSFGAIVGATGAITGRGATASRLGTGSYRVVFSPALANADYSVSLGVYHSVRVTVRIDIGSKTTAGFDLVVENSAGSVTDPSEVFFQVIG